MIRTWWGNWEKAWVGVFLWGTLLGEPSYGAGLGDSFDFEPEGPVSEETKIQETTNKKSEARMTERSGSLNQDSFQASFDEKGSSIEVNPSRVLPPEENLKPLSIEESEKLKDSDGNAQALPEDAPVSVAVVHPIAYLQRGHLLLLAGGSILNGDKFSNSRGGNLGLRYLFSENWGIEAGASLYSSKLTEEVDLLRTIGAQPRVYNPKNIYKIGAVFQPIYGKFLVGNQIQHFRAGFTGGVHFAELEELQVQELDRTFVISQDRTRVTGVQLGAFILFPLRSNFSFQLQTEYLRHQKFRSIDKLTKGDQRQLWLYSAQVGYLF